MKYLYLTFIFLLPYTAMANLDGVYHGDFLRDGYNCEFDADLIQELSNSITFKKWSTRCTLEGQPGPTTSIRGPMTFNLINDHKVEVIIEGESEVYPASKLELTNDAFSVTYQIDSYLEGILLRYDVSINLRLDTNAINYEMKYFQNGQLIFSDLGAGVKSSKRLPVHEE
jgi:hypothetical protein